MFKSIGRHVMAKKKLTAFQKCVSKKLKGKKWGGKKAQRKRFKAAVKECSLEAYYKG